MITLADVVRQYHGELAGVFRVNFVAAMHKSALTHADFIVTNNIRDLEGAELLFEDLKIVKPEQLLREI